MWSDINDERMVRAFQRLDADGSLDVTLEEFNARTKDFVKAHDRNGDGVLTKADRKSGKRHGPKGPGADRMKFEKKGPKGPPEKKDI